MAVSTGVSVKEGVKVSEGDGVNVGGSDVGDGMTVDVSVGARVEAT